ncbi:MAG: hypothetical protein AB2707_06740, partial [Candidatus Thiodiazotropha sp.]
NNLFFALADATISIQGAGVTIDDSCKPLDGEDLEHGEVFNDADASDKFDSPGGGGQLTWLLLLLGMVACLRKREHR